MVPEINNYFPGRATMSFQTHKTINNIKILTKTRVGSGALIIAFVCGMRNMAGVGGIATTIGNVVNTFIMHMICLIKVRPQQG